MFLIVVDFLRQIIILVFSLYISMNTDNSYRRERKNVIEFVCTANVGRSPLAQAIADKYLEKEGLQEKYFTRSRGILVDAITSNSFHPSTKRMYEIILKRAKQDDSFLKNTEHIDNLSLESLTRMYSQSVDYFVAHEILFRDDYAKEHNLQICTVAQQQTRPNFNTLGIFTMNDHHMKSVEQLYDSHAIHATHIQMLGQEEIPDTFSQSRDFYGSVAERIQEQVPIAIESLLRCSK
jgi:protein-tyrosine-phosphatase